MSKITLTVAVALAITGCNVNVRAKFDLEECATRFDQAKTARDSMDVLAYGTANSDPDDCAMQYRISKAGKP